ncbi:MAG: hypothetical protein OHK0039_12240 [Bacteroidia bacterium]
MSALLTLHCAQQASPQGGPKDEVPPSLVRAMPETGTLRFQGDEVSFVFSEPIQAPIFDKEIFISPFVRRPRIILSDNSRRFRIKFQDDLRPQTTYVITLTGVRDLNERNAIKEPIVLAFSTGDVLDSLEIQGRIDLPQLGAKPKDFSILLFDADSIAGEDYLRKRPAYLSKVDENGRFSFRYLRKAPYRILGLADQDQSNTYSQPNEQIAIAADSLVVFPDDSTGLATVVLLAFLPDDQPPRLLNYAWITSQTLGLRFSENLQLDSLQAVATDTTGRDSVSVEAVTWLGGTDRELLVHMPRPQPEPSLLHLRCFADSLGLYSDTVLTVLPARVRTAREPLLEKPALRVERLGFSFVAASLPGEDSTWISLSDTARQDSQRRYFPFRYEQEAFRTWILPQITPDSVFPMALRVSGSMLDDSLLRDSLFAYPVRWLDREDYGSIAGVFRFDSSVNYTGPIVVELTDKDKKRVATLRDTTFNLTMLPEGKYTLRVILDADSNGVWTPGSLLPRRLPERIILPAEPLSVRANWEFVDQVVILSATPPAAAVEKSAGTKPPGRK